MGWKNVDVERRYVWRWDDQPLSGRVVVQRDVGRARRAID
jgi:hypothetical protein